MNTQNIIKQKYKEYFDTAFCIEVFEYIFNPLQALKNINELLKKGGKLYISFHQYYIPHNPEGEDCLRYTLAGIKKLLEKTGFKIIDINTKKLTPENERALMIIFRGEGMRGLYSNSESYEQGWLITCEKI